MSDFSKQAEEMTTAGKPRDPLWKGPEVDGITFSMLSRFLTCRERFRVATIEGLRPVREFNHKIEYGHMFHACDETHSHAMTARTADKGAKNWSNELFDYGQRLVAKYPLSQKQIFHWQAVCKVQFSEYLRYWQRVQQAEDLTSVGQERVFDTKYKLPSGRTVRLRGKIDGVFRKGKTWTIRETKTKGDIDVPSLMRQLTFDLQTMIYSTVLTQEEDIKGPLRVVYNVVRRPLSGGKGSIVRHKPTKSNPAGESLAEYYTRLRGIIADNPGDFFSRFEVGVQPLDLKRFKEKCLDPLLEQVACWYDCVTSSGTLLGTWAQHYQHPFGVWNVLDEGGHTELDNYLATGSKVGLEQIDKLFEEL